MVMDVKWIYCGYHFKIYTNMELCCTLETNTMLHVNYTSIKKLFNLKKKKNGGKT